MRLLTSLKKIAVLNTKKGQFPIDFEVKYLLDKPDGEVLEQDIINFMDNYNPRPHMPCSIHRRLHQGRRGGDMALQGAERTS